MASRDYTRCYGLSGKDLREQAGFHEYDAPKMFPQPSLSPIQIEQYTFTMKYVIINKLAPRFLPLVMKHSDLHITVRELDYIIEEIKDNPELTVEEMEDKIKEIKAERLIDQNAPTSRRPKYRRSSPPF